MRPSKETWFLRMATIASQMTTCVRRAVGCVLVDADNKVLGIGFNGVPSGLPHCNEGNPCPGAHLPSGQGLDECYATHAEANALLQCRDVSRIRTVYCTTAPCIHCVKLLMNTSAHRIVFSQNYPHTAPKALWESVGREWVFYEHGQRGRWEDDGSESSRDQDALVAIGSSRPAVEEGDGHHGTDRDHRPDATDKNNSWSDPKNWPFV